MQGGERRTGAFAPCLAFLLAAAAPVTGAAQTIAVNFQNEAAPVPAGDLRDYGLPYGPRTPAEQVNGGQTYSYGWVQPGTSTPVDLTNQGRDRDILLAGVPADAAGDALQRRDTLTHMDHPSNPPRGDWEIAVPDGYYTVTVSVGDPDVGGAPESHTLNVEGITVIDGFVPSGPDGDPGRQTSASVLVQVSDGRLTLDDDGGVNTKPNYVLITPAAAPTNPSVLATEPVDGATGVAVDLAGVAATDLSLPNGPLDAATVDAGTVRLYPGADAGAAVPASVNTTGGGDAIVLTPFGDLDAFTAYTFEITAGVRDVSGAGFVPFTMSFTTGPPAGGGGAVQFEKVPLAVTPRPYTQLDLGPDGRLYAATLAGDILAWQLRPDGTLQDEQTIVQLAGRIVIGMVFDPRSTASAPVIWATSNEAGFGSATEFSGEIVRITGSDVGAPAEAWMPQTMVVRMPRSTKDHLTNSLVFGPGGELALYGTQGSNTAMGGADSTWGLRPERILSAAVYRVDVALLEAHVADHTAPLDVWTGALGLGDPTLAYDPQGPQAPLTLFATGLRNAYDLAWHSNGFLYVPTNGSAGGGGGVQANAPATPSGFADLAQCRNRIDDAVNGDYAAPSVEQVFPSTRNDYLFKVVAGGYYGHPNPTRCEWVLNGGNPTAGADPGQTGDYAAGTAPDRNWRGFAYDFERNKSPNGIIEYRSNTFDGALQGRLLVVRYSGGDDVLALTPGPDGDIVAAGSLADGDDQTINFANPLDITENPATGELYVAELGADTISLLRPLGSAPTRPELVVAPGELIFDGVKNQQHPANAVLTIANDATAADDLIIDGLSLAGADAAAFALPDLAGFGFPVTLAPGESLSPAPQPVFVPGAAVGTFEAALLIDGNDGQAAVGLYGLGTNGLEGGNEPPLQDVVDTLGHAIDVGWSTLANTTSAALQGEEVAQPLFRRAGPGPVTVSPVARYSPLEPLPFGYYVPGTGGPVLNPLGTLSGVSPQHQTLFPQLADGETAFDPGAAVFGLYTTSSTHTSYTEDALNDRPAPDNHAARVYPLRDRAGSPVPDAFLVGFEEASNGDYNDYVFVVSNVQGASSATLTAEVNIPARGGDGNEAVGLDVLLYAAGSVAPDLELTVTADADGVFTVAGLAPGEYGLAVRGANTLQRVVDLTLVAGENGSAAAPAVVLSLTAGDVTGDNVVDILDLSAIVPAYDTAIGDAAYDPVADLDGDGAVSITDLSAIVPVFGDVGDQPAAARAAPPFD